MTALNPYDELPYRSQPIEWTSPERLALVSLLHGGPRPPLDRYRVLELGCGNGANLLPLAYYRRHGSFVGVDGALDAIATANARARELRLRNLEFIAADLVDAAEVVSGDFDFVIAHGIFSWVPPAAREALLALAAARLRPGGLVYLDHNTRPGWNVRGMVRDYLMAQTSGTVGLRRRAELAQQVAASLAASLEGAPPHAYTELMINEFRFVGEGDVSYVAHEYLSPHNDAFWQSEMDEMTGRHGLVHVAEADFNYESGRIGDGLAAQVAAAKLQGRSVEDTVDLLSFRQHRTAILTHKTWTTRPASDDELAGLRIASALTPLPRETTPQADPGPAQFRHAAGSVVDVKDPAIAAAFERLQPLWPRSLKIGDLFPDVAAVTDDLLLLFRHGMIDLRLVEASDFAPSPRALHKHERPWGYLTTPHHDLIPPSPVGAAAPKGTDAAPAPGATFPQSR
ncbi:MAG TPA: class I SAM-dependent methyltransferase [Polyangia bacterium]